MNNFILIYKVLLNKLIDLDDSFVLFLINCCKFINSKYLYELDYSSVEVLFYEKKRKTMIEQLIYNIAKIGYNDILKTATNGSINFSISRLSGEELCKTVEGFSGEAIGILFLNTSDMVFSLINSEEDVIYFKPESKRLLWYPKNVKIKNMYNDDVSLDVIVFSITSEKIEFDSKIFNEKDYLGEIYNTDKKLYRNQTERGVMDITSNIFYAEKEDRVVKKLNDYLAFNSDNCLYDIYNKLIESEPTNIIEFKNERGVIENKRYTSSNEIKNNNILSLPTTRLRFVEKKFFNDLVCNWIVTESERYAALSGGWLVDRHNTYPTTDIEVENIPSVFSFMITSVIQEVKNRLEILYSINIDSFNVTDLFIAKYELNGQKNLDVHRDGTSERENFTFSILLNDNFKGSAIRYEDGGVVNPKKGDMMVHTRNHPHRVEKLTDGVRYVMVGFLNIGIKNN